MEEYKGFYEFLRANLKKKEEESKEKKPSSANFIVGWIALILLNSLALQITWNLLSDTLFLPQLTYLKALSLFILGKTLFRGFFSLQ